MGFRQFITILYLPMTVYNTYLVMWRNTFLRLGSSWHMFCPTVSQNHGQRTNVQLNMISRPTEKQVLSPHSQIYTPCVQHTQIQSVWQHNSRQTSQKNYKYAYKYTATWPLWKSITYYQTKCTVQYLTKLPRMMHQIQFHIVQLPTSQLHLIPVNATKLI
jgi:hypothetical protein